MADQFVGQAPDDSWDWLRLYVSGRDWLEDGQALSAVSGGGSGFLVNGAAGLVPVTDQEGRYHAVGSYWVLTVIPTAPDFSAGPVEVSVSYQDDRGLPAGDRHTFTINLGQLRTAWLDPIPLDPDSVLDWFWSWDDWLQDRTQVVSPEEDYITAIVAAVVSGPIQVRDVRLNPSAIDDTDGRTHRAASVVKATVTATPGWTEGDYAVLALTASTAEGRRRTAWARFRIGDR